MHILGKLGIAFYDEEVCAIMAAHGAAEDGFKKEHGGNGDVGATVTRIEMLAMIAKIGAIYVQDMNDATAVNAVDKIEELTTGLSRKIWQKVMLLQ